MIVFRKKESSCSYLQEISALFSEMKQKSGISLRSKIFNDDIIVILCYAQEWIYIIEMYVDLIKEMLKEE